MGILLDARYLCFLRSSLKNFVTSKILMPHFLFLIAGLNFSSSQSQTPPLDNRTIQSFVKDYVDEYVGGYAEASLAAVLFGPFVAVSKIPVDVDTPNTTH